MELNEKPPKMMNEKNKIRFVVQCTHAIEILTCLILCMQVENFETTDYIAILNRK